MSNLYKHLFFILFLSICACIPLQAKSIEYKMKKNFITKLQNENKNTIGGYAKYNITLYIASQKDIEFLKKEQSEISHIIEQSVSNYNSSQLQSHNDRRTLEREITKKLNQQFNKTLIKATFFEKMSVVPDATYN